MEKLNLSNLFFNPSKTEEKKEKEKEKKEEEKTENE